MGDFHFETRLTWSTVAGADSRSRLVTKSLLLCQERPTDRSCPAGHARRWPGSEHHRTGAAVIERRRPISHRCVGVGVC